MPKHTRFAAYGEDGQMVALVADGIPQWPADDNLSAIADGDLHAMEQSYLTEFTRLAALPETALEVLEGFHAHIGAIRTETAARFARAAAEPAPVVESPAPAPTAAPAPSAEEREAALARMRGDLAPAPEPVATPTETVPTGPAFSREDLVAAVQAGAEAAALAVTTSIVPTITEAITAASRPVRVVSEPEPVSARGIGAYRDQSLVANAERRKSVGKLNPNLQMTVDAHHGNTHLAVGQTVPDLSTFAEILADRWEHLGTSSGTKDESVNFARMSLANVPEERDLRGLGAKEMKAKVMKVVGPGAPGIDPFTGKESLVASGGLPYPLEPYYGQAVISDSSRLVPSALTNFVGDRGGITTVLPPGFVTIAAATRPGSFSDGVTATSTAFTSATAAFSQADVGKPIIETDAQGVIPIGTIINSVTNATTVVLSAATTGTTTGVAFYLQGRNPNNLGNPVGIVTAAQDALGPPTTIKYTYDVVAGAQVSYPVYALYVSTQFANLTARVNPESVEANIKLCDAVAARVGDTQMLGIINGYSTLLTAPKTFGTARQLMGQLGHEAAFFRNAHRMDPKAVLMVGMPAWVVNNMRQDYFNTFLGVAAADWALSDDEIDGWFASKHLMPWYFWDGPPDVNQLFATSGIPAATSNLSTSTVGTPMTLPDWPNNGQGGTSFRNTVVTYMWDPSVWLGITTGELNIGLVRDSVLNSQNRFRNFSESFETPAFIGPQGSTMRNVHSVIADGSYGAAASITVAPGSGL
jgi:hypothetical protein